MSSGVFSSLVSFVQPICIVLLQQALPPLFLAMSKIEGQLSFCDVQIRAFSRYFAFQVVNVFLITAIAGSIFETAALIAENPGKVFQVRLSEESRHYVRSAANTPFAATAPRLRPP